MNSQFARTVILAGLLMGCIALAFPQFTQKLEAWLFDGPASLATEKSADKPTPLAAAMHPEQQAGFTTSNQAFAEPRPLHAEPATRRNFAFGYEEEPRQPQPERKYAVQPSSLEQQENRASPELVHWQRMLEQLGAKYVVVETQGDRYQCRCLIPLADGSAYEKAFAAENLDPSQAMQAVVEQVKIWKAQKAERWEQNKSRELRR